MATDVVKLTTLNNSVFISPEIYSNVEVCRDAEFLPHKVTSCFKKCLEDVLTYLNSRKLETNLIKNFNFLKQEDILEIKRIYKIARDIWPLQNSIKLKDDRDNFSYLIREKDFIVYTKIHIGEGEAKKVNQVLSIDEDGNVDLKAHIKLNKLKRDYGHYKLIEHEYHLRKILESPRILAPGSIYVYKSKLGIEKISWVCPFYNKTADDVIPSYLEGILEEKKVEELISMVSKLPFYTIELSLDMALCLKELHSKKYVHRDIKLENFLVDFDLEAKKVKSCVVSDLAFCGSLEEFNDDKKKAEAKLIRRFFPDGVCDIEKIKKNNPKFASLCKDGDMPSLKDYKEIHEQDPDGVNILKFLAKLDQYLIVGTPGHIAPEVYTQRTYSETTDLYSLGYAFYKLKNQLELVAVFPSFIEESYLKLIKSLTSNIPSERLNLDFVIQTLEDFLKKKNN